MALPNEKWKFRNGVSVNILAAINLLGLRYHFFTVSRSNGCCPLHWRRANRGYSSFQNHSAGLRLKLIMGKEGARPKGYLQVVVIAPHDVIFIKSYRSPFPIRWVISPRRSAEITGFFVFIAGKFIRYSGSDNLPPPNEISLRLP